MQNLKNYLSEIVPQMNELGIDPEDQEQILRYVNVLWEANQSLNLFSRKMPAEDLIRNHILDCLLAYPFFKKIPFEVLADFGSGGGMPGALLAILFPKAEVRLFEKSPKKTEFLMQLKREWPNIHPLGEIKDEALEPVDLITARAFKPLAEIFRFSKNYLRKGGSYCLYKARLVSIEEELRDAQRFLKNHPWKRVPLSNPLLEVERNLVLVGNVVGNFET